MQTTILAFNANNQLAIRRAGASAGVSAPANAAALPFTAPDLPAALAQLETHFKTHTAPVPCFTFPLDGNETQVYLAQVSPDDAAPAAPEIQFASIDTLVGASLATPSVAPSAANQGVASDAPTSALQPFSLSALSALLPRLAPHLIDIPYLHLGENDFIYKFRPDKERNRLIYQPDAAARALYQSRLCAAIKTLARASERTAAAPVTLDFGAVRYLIPSHFGFCLGVKNAIERAYETLAENPDRRVFMLSELIHNPYVNEDLRRRGLRYLQTDKGVPILATGLRTPASDTRSPESGVQSPATATLWDTLTPDDIVIIPAFGATDEDKRRLVRKGLPVVQYDATCMLVEKVWKAARAFGREGYTIIIHGKHEHEETKATFSNARRHAPALIVRNLAEARLLTDIMHAAPPPQTQAPAAAAPVLSSPVGGVHAAALSSCSRGVHAASASPPASTPAPTPQQLFDRHFAGRHTPNFDIARDLQRIAVVNQTTLLMNETLDIIEHLRSAYAAKYGPAEADARVGGNARRDTLCYATQVNQDALSRALAEPLDAAIVIGGKNSSNTYQLYRLCEQRLGPRAFFIQSEENIRTLDAIEHYHFPAHAPRHESAALSDNTELKPLATPARLAEKNTPLRLLITGGASCPDGIIQQVITRINSHLPPATLRPIESILADLEK